MTPEEIKRQKMIEELQQNINPLDDFPPSESTMAPVKQLQNNQDIEVDKDTEISRTPSSNDLKYEYDKDLLNAIKNNDQQKERELLRGLTPIQVRSKYDDISDYLINNKIGDVDKNVFLKIRSMLGNDTSEIPIKIVGPENEFLDKKNAYGVFTPSKEELTSRAIPSTIVHELGHASDYVYHNENMQNKSFKKGNKENEPIGNISDVDVNKALWRRKAGNDMDALTNAERRLAGHHLSTPIFSRGAAYNIANNLPYAYSPNVSSKYPPSGQNYAPGLSSTYPLSEKPELREFLSKMKNPTMIDIPEKGNEYAPNTSGNYQYTNTPDEAISNIRRDLILKSLK